MIDAEIEVFILIKGFDESYSQTIYSRSSYTAKDFVFGGKFIRPFYVDESGMLVIDLTKVGDFEKVEIEKLLPSLN
jgi:inward rectifier potassium channel